MAKVSKKSKLAIVGMAEKTRHLTPWDDLDFEIWGLNEAYNVPEDGVFLTDPEEHAEKPKFMKRWDRWFQIHSFASFSRENNPNDPNHYKWLQQPHDFPIYMQEQYPNIPASVRYPIEEATARFGRYFTSTFAYMMALGIMEGFKEIHVYGFEMGAKTEYYYQKPNAEYFIGFAHGLGINVIIPEKSSLVRGQLYGYSEQMIPLRQSLEFRLQTLRGFEREYMQQVFYCQGAGELASKYAEKYPELKEEMNLFTNKQIVAAANASGTKGAIQEVEHTLNVFDAYCGLGWSQEVLDVPKK